MHPNNVKHASCLTEDTLVTHLAYTSMYATTVKMHWQDFNSQNTNHCKMHNRTNKCQIKNKTPVNAKLLKVELQGYDIDLSNLLVQGYNFGFLPNLQGTPSNKTFINHKSST